MAKKKDSAIDMSVEEKLKNLYQLQTMLSEIDKIKILRGELPLEVQDLEDEIEGLRTRIEHTHMELDDLYAKDNDLHRKIDDAEVKLRGYQQHLDNVSNNREYDTLCKEIEYQNLEIELSQKRIRETGQEIRRKEDALRQSEQMLDERYQDLDLKKSELDEIVAETKAEEEKLREKSKALELTIEPRLLSAFKRIRNNSRNGLGIVYVQRDACGGCFAKIPPQRQLDVRMRKKVIVCEYCGRILIDAELAGVNLNEPVKEEKPKRRRLGSKKKEEE